MNSLELLKKNKPKVWWSAILVVITYLFVQGISWDYFVKIFVKDNTIGNLLSFIIGLLFILLWVKYVEKNKFLTLGFQKKDIIKNYILGLTFAAVVSVTIIVIILFFDGFGFKLSNNRNYTMIIILIILFLIQGLTEEVVFRGYLMNRIASAKGKWWGVIVNSIFFTVFHAANTGMTYIASLNIFIASFMLSLLFWYTDNIWLVGAFHGAWNFIVGVIFGINISGIRLSYTLLDAELNSNKNLYNGSVFGIEGSVIMTVMYVILCIIIYMGLYVQMFKRIAKKNK
ncbi:CPBP family intramembrane glutamic endopeptidase [Gemella cuniculi]|uniref:CPBP family intramembrane glutamic endopeptidase n=1 Tax=Gemella cuniculi TaxID=150240 RepID=UPI00040AA663|nr:type II CAAX endopeptidase family protein [Gemella cuniculi]